MKKFVFLFAMIIIIASLIVWNGSSSSPQKTTNEFLQSIQKGKWKSASNYIENPDAKEYFLGETHQKYNRILFEKMAYTTGEIQKDSKKATIDLKITTIDTRKAQDKAFEKIKKEILEKDSNDGDGSYVVDTIPYVIKIAKNPSAKKVTLPVKIKLVKVGDAWKVDLTEDFMDALTGIYERDGDESLIMERISPSN
ncbi:DUF5105 domain-containing protein [Bacillus sp. AFS031507]|uniref:DUF5105 domain-containing protein n=1 Tax=Bacillus sp. AFS031507 TaxID=2033496 RepID=UPI000BFC1AF8|nr:DUF5105 domain-containing protein [Bacillus sp. AFS031507]PGY06835.1 hypothetical protein COE25_26255 [Bacillus sp. AFS031507]